MSYFISLHLNHVKFNMDVQKLLYKKGGLFLEQPIFDDKEKADFTYKLVIILVIKLYLQSIFNELPLTDFF